jgi:hypothetical protein
MSKRQRRVAYNKKEEQDDGAVLDNNQDFSKLTCRCSSVNVS